MKTVWNNKQGSRDSRAWCLLVTLSGSVHKFTGDSIPGVCSAVVADYTKDGKWSNSTFEITHHDTTIVVSFMDDWGTGKAFPQVSWEAGFFWLAVKAPMLSKELFEGFIRESFPKTAAAWDESRVAEAEFGFSATPEQIAAMKTAAEKVAADKAAYEIAERARMESSPFAALLAMMKG
jgi:hypothetical protein